MELTTERKGDIVPWRRAVTDIRNEIATALEYGAAIGTLASLLALAGLMNQCPYCGGWHGGSPPRRFTPQAPPLPDRLIKALSTPVKGEPTPTEELPSRNSKLTSKHLLEKSEKRGDQRVKVRTWPLESDGSRKIDTYHGGFGKPDGPGHGHTAEFNHGNERGILYKRAPQGEGGAIIQDSAFEVTYNPTEGYIWTRKAGGGDNA